MPRRIAIVTHHNDLHALGVQALLRRRGHQCSVISGDRLAASPAFTWSLHPDDGPSAITDDEATGVEVGALDAVWWRRAPAPPTLPRERMAPEARTFVANNVRAALFGAFLADFRGAWVDHPDAIRNAENKLVQLRVAEAAGFRVPRTLVSQNPEHIRQFWHRLDAAVIAKGVAGALGVPALTGRIEPQHLDQPRSLEMCPAIYQELIPGTRHLRVNVFGAAVQAALIETDQLDWRYPLQADFSPYPLGADLSDRLREVLGTFGLSMGIFDLKLTPNDEPVWLELNPQGQFLFVEALGGGELLRIFSTFLEERADEGRARPFRADHPLHLTPRLDTTRL